VDEAKGWIARASVQDDKLVSLQRFIATTSATGVSTPTAIAVSPRHELVVGQMGARVAERDSQLSFFHGSNGRLLLSLPAGLFDVTALAYGPNGQLYATDFASTQSDQGGLFQLIARLASGRPKRRGQAGRPTRQATAMAFAADGKLYVTVFGAASPGSKSPSGKLLRITL